jgi:hypothetical protein
MKLRTSSHARAKQVETHSPNISVSQLSARGQMLHSQATSKATHQK